MLNSLKINSKKESTKNKVKFIRQEKIEKEGGRGGGVFLSSQSVRCVGVPRRNHVQ